MKLRLLGLIALLSAPPCLWAIAGSVNAPIWKQPLNGTTAFLGDDGGGVDTATVCDTAEHAEAWVNYGNPPGCESFPRGLKVIVKGLLLDPPGTDPSDKTIYPLVRIKIPSVDYAGYVQLFWGIHPMIPKGTTVHLRQDGADTLRLATSQNADSESGQNLGQKATAKVLRYDPSATGFNLYVEILDGKYAGSTGWVLTMDAAGDDGEPPDIFAQSIVDHSTP